MPWNQSVPMTERMKFIVAHQSGAWSMTELCARFGVSRRVGYKWLHRFEAEGIDGLKDCSRAPRRSPQRMDPVIERLLVEARQRHPHWGPRKIIPWLLRRHPGLAGRLPAPSTVGDLFRRHGLVRTRKRRRVAGHRPAGALHTTAPNEVWSADFKGEFLLRNGRYCYPFTLADAHSRYLLSCTACRATELKGARAALIRAFRTYGLPGAIRTDNGTPFVGHGQTGLSTLSVWWTKLGIEHQRIPKRRPDQNGRHERMHRTLKAEATRPPEREPRSQQRRFDAFRTEFNQERPHEALAYETPADVYQPSPRRYPEQLPSPHYEGHWEKRKVGHGGAFKFRTKRIFVAEPLRHEWLGLEEVKDGVWSVYFHRLLIGRLHENPGILSV
jgi:putative transposase